MPVGEVIAGQSEYGLPNKSVGAVPGELFAAVVNLVDTVPESDERDDEASPDTHYYYG